MARILVIDDEYVVRHTVARILTRDGHEVREVEDGRHALQVHREWQADLILTDVVMPDCDGLELIRNIRAEDPNVRVIAMSGGGQIGPTLYLDLARKFGANSVLQKPVGRQAVLDAVTAQIDGE